MLSIPCCWRLETLAFLLLGAPSDRYELCSIWGQAELPNVESAQGSEASPGIKEDLLEKWLVRCVLHNISYSKSVQGAALRTARGWIVSGIAELRDGFVGMGGCIDVL